VRFSHTITAGRSRASSERAGRDDRYAVLLAEAQCCTRLAAGSIAASPEHRMIPLRDDNPTTLTPIVTVTIIITCVLVFLWQISHSEDGQQLIAYAFGLVPAVLFTDARLPPELAIVPPQVTVFTSMFLHGGWLHLIGNMLYLWIFGNNVEDAMGHGRFIAFYLLCGVAAALAQSLPNPDSTIPMIGASGALSGVLGAYLLLHPHARVLVGIPIFVYLHITYLPASVMLGIWFLLQIVSSLNVDPEQGGVAWFAHIGGFVAGMVLIPFFKHSDVPLFGPRRRR
jgi:membrane associated rhomboid family serine protease